MFIVEMYKNGVVAYDTTFETEEEAKEWAKNHSSGIKDYKVKKEEIKAVDIVKEIQNILCATDWLFISDVPLAKEFRVVFKDYRQMLRKLRIHSVKVEGFENWLRRNRPEYFLEGRQGPKMVEKSSKDAVLKEESA